MPAAKKAVTTRTPSTRKVAKPKTESAASIADNGAPVFDSQPQDDGLNAKLSGAPFRADWRDQKGYPPPDCNDMAKLAWEFLRRNKKYASHVQQMLALPPGEYENGLTVDGNAKLDGTVCTPAAMPGETVKKFRKRVAKKTNGKTKGMIEKPQLTFINRWMLERPVRVEHSYDADVIQFVPNVVKAYRNKELTGRRVRLMMYHNEVAVRYRLDLPLQPQINKAKQLLSKTVKRFNDAAMQSSNDKKSEVLVSNAKSRKKNSVGHDAHFWLRVYDAANEPKLLLDDTDKNRKRAQKSGPSEIAKKFLDEGVTKTFERGVVEGYHSSAERMIDKLGYQKLVVVIDVAPKSSLARVWHPMTTKPFAADECDLEGSGTQG